MGGEANVWEPRTTIEIQADTKSVEERITALQNQVLFTLTDFVYVVGTGALEIHRNGLLLTKNVDWVEQTASTFSLVVPSTAGDQVVASGKVGITGLVDVRDTDIFVLNYQAIRDYAGTEITLYSQGQTTRGDGGENFFQNVTGAAPGFYVDNNTTVIVPTGGDGSAAWIRPPAPLATPATVAAMVADPDLVLGQTVAITDYATGNQSGVMIGSVVAAATGTADGGKYIDLPNTTPALQWEQNLPKFGGKAKLFGIVGDATADDTTQVESFIAYVNSSLGALADFSDVIGTMRLTNDIEVPARSLTIKGAGRLHVYPYEEAAGYAAAEKLTTFLVDHNDRNAFTMIQDGGARGFLFIDANVIRKSGSTCTAAFGFDVVGTVTGGKNYGYDTVFRRAGIFDFVSAFDMYASGAATDPSMAAILIDDCAINRNDWIARNLDSSQWNGFTFINNKAGQQTTGGLDIRAHKFEEHGNVLEGCPNPIKVAAGFRGFTSFGSYFEANTGRALIEVAGQRGPVNIGANTIIANSTTAKVILSNVGLVNSDIPYIGDQIYKGKQPWFGDNNSLENDLPNVDPITFGVSGINPPTSDVLVRPENILTFDTNSVSGADRQRAVSPFNGRAMPLERYTTAGVGAITDILTIAGNSGEYVNVTILIKHVPDGLGNPNPYVTLNVNGTSDTGSRDYSFAEASSWYREGDWMVIHAVIKLGVAMTSLHVTFFTYGLAPTLGRDADFFPAHAYTAVDLRDCRPYLDPFEFEHIAAIPTTGTWVRGDKFGTTTPVAAGKLGFVCITAGSPGTWKPYGAIDA